MTLGNDIALGEKQVIVGKWRAGQWTITRAELGELQLSVREAGVFRNVLTLNQLRPSYRDPGSDQTRLSFDTVLNNRNDL